MFFKKKPDDRVILAHIEGTFERKETGHGIAIALGFFVMIAIVIFETNLIRLVAWSTLWVGWNVIQGIGLFMQKKIELVVYREPQRLPPTLD